MSVPTVSVVMPVFNGGEFLADAVLSILRQTYTDFELLVIDDGSTDHAVDSVEKSIQDSRVRFLRHENRGLAATLNRGIEESDGKFICRMDADDLALADRLAVQVDYLTRNPDVVLVGTQIRRIAGGKLGKASTFPLKHDDILHGLLRREHVICHPSTLMRKSALATSGGYWDHGVSEDWDLFLRLSELGSLANVDVPLLQYRFHDSGINVSSLAAVRWNMRVAIANYRRRPRCMKELGPQEFIRDASCIDHLMVKLEVRSLRFYRRHLHYAASGDHILSCLSLGFAAALWPTQALRRLSMKSRLRPVIGLPLRKAGISR